MELLGFSPFLSVPWHGSRTLVDVEDLCFPHLAVSLDPSYTLIIEGTLSCHQELVPKSLSLKKSFVLSNLVATVALKPN